MRKWSPLARVNLYAYGTLKYGLNVGPGDTDGDGFDETVVAPGPGPTIEYQSRFRVFEDDDVSIAPLPGRRGEPVHHLVRRLSGVVRDRRCEPAPGRPGSRSFGRRAPLRP